MEQIEFTKAKLPYGWMGNMSRFPVIVENRVYETTEHLFKCLRFGLGSEIAEEIRQEKNPMCAKLIARKKLESAKIQRCSKEDIANMEFCLLTKLDQHKELLEELLNTGNAHIVENCNNRKPSPWGAQYIDGKWVGENLLGKCWMKIRGELRGDT